MSGSRVTRARTAARAEELWASPPPMETAGGHSVVSTGSSGSSGRRRRRHRDHRGATNPAHHGPGTRAAVGTSPSIATEEGDSGSSGIAQGVSRVSRRTRHHIPFPGASCRDNISCEGNANISPDMLNSGERR